MKKMIKSMSDESIHPEFRRHAYLAYQWIKRKDLTKAENPKTTRSRINVPLLTQIINFFSGDQTLESELKEYVDKTYPKIHGYDYVGYFIHKNTITNKEEFSNIYFLILKGLFFDVKKYINIIRYLIDYTPIRPKILIKDDLMYIRFENRNESFLQLIFKENWNVSDPIFFTIKSKSMESSGNLTLDSRSSKYVLEPLINIIAKERIVK